MDLEAIFEFVGDNPTSILIMGGILLILVSVVSGPFDSNTTNFLRAIGLVSILLGFVAQVLWLVIENR